MIKDKNKEMIRFITDKLVTYLSKFTQDRIYLDDNTIIVYTDDNDTVPYLMFLIKDTDAINDEETIDLYKSNGTKELNIVYNNAIYQYNLKLVDYKNVVNIYTKKDTFSSISHNLFKFDCFVLS